MDIVLSNIRKSFGKKPVLQDISLTAPGGEILCLLGPSGAGKTTLIRLITGGLRADGGTVKIGGTLCPNREIMRHVGLMPQSDAVYPDISGMENLLFFGRLFGLKGKALKERAEELLGRMRLTEDKDKTAAAYSGGMKKRLSLAIALLPDPEVLLLDEPTVGIDPVLRKSIWDIFENLRQSGRTILVSTHVMEEAEKCQKAALLYGGRLIEHDSLSRLLEKTKSGRLEELFFAAETAGQTL